MNRTGKGWFVKGRRSANPAGRPKKPAIPPPPPGYAPDLTAVDRRPIRNLVVEARRFSGLAVDTLVELTKDSHTDSTRYAAATALLDRGYGRPAQSLDLHLSADAITKRLSDMTDAELAALEARMIAAAPIVLEATADVSDDAGDVEDSPPGAHLSIGPSCRHFPKNVVWLDHPQVRHHKHFPLHPGGDLRMNAFSSESRTGENSG
jgi:hypothetical protein